MGVNVRLDIVPEAIDADAWDQFYGLVRQWLAGYPTGLVTLRREAIGDGTRLVYSRAIEHDADDPDRRSLRVCGDSESMQMAESFVLYGDLARYRNRYRTEAPATRRPDILDLYLADGGTVQVYSEKTQGYPYHGAVLGVAVLAEGLFQGAALAGGDITAAQCEQAVQDIADRLGVGVSVPLQVDAERLYARLVGTAPTLASLDQFVHTFLGPMDEAIRTLSRQVPRDLALDWLALRMGQYDGKLTLGIVGLLRDWMDATGDLDGLIVAAAIRPGGPRFDPIVLAEGLVSAGVALEPEAIAGLDLLERPPSLPPSVASLFGNAMLDAMGLSARGGRARLGAAAVIERLQHHLPDHAEACRAAVREGTKGVRQSLGDLGRWAATAEPQAGEDVELGDGESFVRRRVGDALSGVQDVLLHEVAATLRRDWDFFRSELQKRLGDDRHRRWQALLRAASDQGLALTERGWAWIDAEDDLARLDLLLMLLARRGIILFWVNLCRGVFEHRDLCERLRHLIANPA